MMTKEGSEGLNAYFYIQQYPENSFGHSSVPEQAQRPFKNAPDTGWHVGFAQSCSAEAPVWCSGVYALCRQTSYR